MDHLTTDTVPFALVPGSSGAAFVVSVDDRTGSVVVRPADAQKYHV